MAGLLSGNTALCHQFASCRLNPAPSSATVVRRGRHALEISASRVADPVLVNLKSFSGEAKGQELLALKTADANSARGLVHRYIVMIQQNKRRGTASTLTRAEVRGGGRKPFPQKGTGNARMGSMRTPLRPGGGVVFGPKPKDWSIKMNKKERRLALATALQSAASSSIIVDDITGSLTAPKTKAIVGALAQWGCTPGSSTMLVVNEMTRPLVLSTRNIPRLHVTAVTTLNAYEVLKADNVVYEASAFKYVQEYFGAKEPTSVDSPAESSEAAPQGEATGEAPESPAESPEAPAEGAE